MAHTRGSAAVLTDRLTPAMFGKFNRFDSGVSILVLSHLSSGLQEKNPNFSKIFHFFCRNRNPRPYPLGQMSQWIYGPVKQVFATIYLWQSIVHLSFLSLDFSIYIGA